jgi:RNA polymerase sigma-70 factor (ECF subfamily)
VPLSDVELIARVLLDDNHDAFSELVSRYQSPLRAWFRRLTNGDAARSDDLAQETFLRAYRGLSTFRSSGKFQAWLFGIAYNEFRNDLRRGRRFVELKPEVANNIISDQDGHGGQNATTDLDAAMQSLTVEQRAAITLCFQQGLTHEEAAMILKCPLGTIKTNILRGKERLRRYFHTTASAK